MDNTSELEHIEWDLPVSEMQKMSKDGGQESWMDLSKLSLGTEMRNKLWEQEHKEVLGLREKPQHFQSNDNPFPEHSFMNGKFQADEQSQRGKAHPAAFFNHTNQHMFDFNNVPRNNNNMRNGFHGGNSLNPHSPSFSPSHQAQVTSAAEESVQGGVNGRGEGRFPLSGHGV